MFKIIQRTPIPTHTLRNNRSCFIKPKHVNRPVNHRQYSKSSYVPRIKGAVLDFSGTIVDSGVLAPTYAFQEVFSRADVPVSIKDIRRYMGHHKKVHIQNILNIPEVRNRWKKVHNQYPTDDDVDNLYKNFTPCLLEILPHYCQVIPEAKNAIHIMKNKYHMQIGTTTGFTRVMVDTVLKHMEDIGLDFTVASDEVICPRPAYDGCNMNRQMMNIENPAEMIKVGDTSLDMLEGYESYMWTIGLSKYSNLMGMSALSVEEFKKEDSMGYWKKIIDIEKIFKECGAHYVAEDMSELPQIIDDINKKLICGITPENIRKHPRY